MDRLWTPWRMEYIKGDARREGCIFCDFPAQDPAQDRENLIVARGERAFVILNKFPYNSGHVVVAPYSHVPNFEDLKEDEQNEMARWTTRIIRALRDAYHPEGFNVGMNQGLAAGAGIADHLHGHVVPRWAGDTNFMTTVGDTKVLPEALHETWAKLSPLLAT